LLSQNFGQSAALSASVPALGAAASSLFSESSIVPDTDDSDFDSSILDPSAARRL